MAVSICRAHGGRARLARGLREKGRVSPQANQYTPPRTMGSENRLIWDPFTFTLSTRRLLKPQFLLFLKIIGSSLQCEIGDPAVCDRAVIHHCSTQRAGTISQIECREHLAALGKDYRIRIVP